MFENKNIFIQALLAGIPPMRIFDLIQGGSGGLFPEKQIAGGNVGKDHPMYGSAIREVFNLRGQGYGNEDIAKLFAEDGPIGKALDPKVREFITKEYLSSILRGKQYQGIDQ